MADIRELSYEASVIPTTLAQMSSLLRMLLGDANYVGVSQGPIYTRVHHNNKLTGEETVAVIGCLQSGAYGLTVVTDKLSIPANDTDTATITASGAAMASDASVAYQVRFTGRIGAVEYAESDYGSGTAAVTAGQAQLTLKTPTAGEYHILVRRTAAGSVHIGRVVVTATAP